MPRTSRGHLARHELNEFVKARGGAIRADWEMEAAGLRWIAEAAGIRVPEMLAVEDERMVIRRIHEGSLSSEGAEELGRGLAAMHALGAECFGSLPPGAPDRMLRIGLAPSRADGGRSWPGFYASQILLEPLASEGE